MALKFRCFNHRKTGQACYVPAGRYGNFLNSIKKLVSYVRYNIDRYYILHLTLTVAENVGFALQEHDHLVLRAQEAGFTLCRCLFLSPRRDAPQQ